jgi:hypothetical protein
MEIVLTLVLFALAMGGMALGVIFSNRALRGSCGGESVRNGQGEVISCGACPKKESEVCPTDEPLVALAQIGHPNPRHRH